MHNCASGEQPVSQLAPSPSKSTSCPIDSLDVAQLAALGWLTEGKTIRAAAEAVGVSRDTVSRWIRRDVAFRAAYNAWRQELIESTRARLLRTAETAAAVVYKAIANGNGRLALSLLKHLDLTRGATAGPTDPGLVEGEIAILDEEQRHVLGMRALHAGDYKLSATHPDWRKHLTERRQERALAAD